MSVHLLTAGLFTLQNLVLSINFMSFGARANGGWHCLTLPRTVLPRAVACKIFVADTVLVSCPSQNVFTNQMKVLLSQEM